MKQFSLHHLKVLEIIKVWSRCCSGQVVENYSLGTTIQGFKVSWLSQFRSPEAIHSDGSFNNTEVTDYLSKLDIDLGPVISRKHSENPLEHKHGVILSKLLRVKYSDPISCLKKWFHTNQLGSQIIYVVQIQDPAFSYPKNARRKLTEDSPI